MNDGNFAIAESLITIDFVGASDSLDHGDELPTVQIVDLQDDNDNPLSDTPTVSDGIDPEFYAMATGTWIQVDDIHRNYAANTTLDTLYRDMVHGGANFVVTDGNTLDLWVKVDPLSAAPGTIEDIISVAFGGSMTAYVGSFAALDSAANAPWTSNATWNENVYEKTGLDMASVMDELDLIDLGDQFDQGDPTDVADDQDVRCYVKLTDAHGLTKVDSTDYTFDYDIHEPTVALVPTDSLKARNPDNVYDNNGEIIMRDDVQVVALAPSDKDVKWFQLQYSLDGVTWVDLVDVSVDTAYFDNMLWGELLLREPQFIAATNALQDAITGAWYSMAVWGDVDTDSLQIKDGLSDPVSVYFRVLAYDLAGNMNEESSGETPLMRLDNSPPDVAGGLTLYEQDGSTPVAGTDVIGRANYKVKAELTVAELADIARITFDVRPDSAAAAPQVQLADETPPFFLDWTVPRVRNFVDTDGNGTLDKLVADHAQLYYLVLLAEDLVGNFAAVDTLAVIAHDRDAPQAMMFAINGVQFNVANNINVPHIPRAGAVIVAAEVDTFAKGMEDINRDILTADFEYRQVPNGDWMSIESITGKIQGGLIVDLFQPENSNKIVVTWDTRNLPGGDYNLRAITTDIEGNVNKSSATVASAVLDTTSQRAYVMAPKEATTSDLDTLIAEDATLVAYTYNLTNFDLIDRVLFRYKGLTSDGDWETSGRISIPLRPIPSNRLGLSTSLCRCWNGP
jgi:hypothetical protein